MESLCKLYKSADVRSVSDSPNGGFSGYGSVFHALDYHGDIVAPGAYKSDLDRFLKRGFMGGSGHDHNKPIGKFKSAIEDRSGLWVEGEFASTHDAQEVRALISEGVISSLSVGILPLQVKRLRNKSEVMQYWSDFGYEPTEEELQRAEGGARLIKRAKLLEISPVALPANEHAEIVSYKSGRKISGENLDKIRTAIADVRAAIGRLEDLASSVDPTQAEGVSEDALEDVSEESLESFDLVLASFKAFAEGK